MKSIIKYFRNKRSFIQSKDFRGVFAGTLIGCLLFYFMFGYKITPNDHNIFFGLLTTMFFLTTAIVEVISFKSYPGESTDTEISLNKKGYLSEHDKYIAYYEIKEKFKDSPTKLLMLEKEIFDTKNISIKEINKKANQIENNKLY